MTAVILRGDARALPLADASVDLVVTSPPFWALRSYTDTPQLCDRCRQLSDGFVNPGDAERNLRQAWPDWDAHVAAEHRPGHYAGQIGAEPTPAQYVDNLLACTREWMRVLTPSGSLWVNLGDKYSGAQAQNVGGKNRAGDSARTWRQTNPRNTGIPNKSLMGLPWRYALRCVDELGLILRAEVIWSKPNGLPESVTDRVRRSHEQWFWLTRWSPDAPAPADLVRSVLDQVAAGTLTVDEAERLLTVDAASHETWFHMTRAPRYYAAVDRIRQPTTPQNGKAGTFKRDKPSHTLVPGQAATQHRADRPDVPAYNPLGALPGSVWTVPTQPLKVPDHVSHAVCCAGRRRDGCTDGVDHFAAFPMEWPRRIVQGWSPEGICTGCGEGRRPVAAPTGERGRVPGGRVREKKRTYANLSTAALVVREIVGEVCACPDTSAPTRPAVVLDPCGGTGTTALVAEALGRVGVSVDMSADYCRLAQWRTTDPGQRAAALEVEKPAVQLAGQDDLLTMLEAL